MTRFEQAVAEFRRLNADDPNRIVVDGVERPKQLVEAERIAEWVTKLSPDASEALKLAAHCQHIKRWEIPRSDYPDGRTGYLTWRKDLSRFHAETAAKVLHDVGYDDATIEQVERINKKRALSQDPEVQLMEDALCLAFLEHDAAAFAAKHPDDKVIDILQKTWAKMSARAHDEALKLDLEPGFKALVARAIG